MNIQKIIEENKKRLAEMYKPYNPILGIGSSIDRFLFHYGDTELYLPDKMLEIEIIKKIAEAGDAEKLFKDNNIDISKETFLQILLKERINYDFEFWAYTCTKIQDKKSKKDIPFSLNRPQRRLLSVLIGMYFRGIPIRVIILKARQWGGSTLVEIFYLWLQTTQFLNWHSVIVGDVEQQARNVRTHYTRISKSYPTSIGSITLKPHEGSSKNRIIEECGAIISIGSAQEPDSLRSSDNALIHATEVGMWKSSPARTPESLMQSLRATIPDENGTAIILESTAKGVNSFFHNEWVFDTGYEKFFVAWHESDLYMKTVEDYPTFIQSMNEYENFLWNEGATLEGIYWYRNELKSYKGEHWRFMQEYPTTADEAFQTSGKRFYSPTLIQEAKKTCYPPIWRGDIQGKELCGKRSLENIELIQNPEGDLYIWAQPDKSQNISNRYIITVDLGGLSSSACFSSINVFDRYYLMEDGAMERAATWVGKIDHDLVAWKAAQLGFYYRDTPSAPALLVVEKNSLRGDKDEESGHSIIVLDTIADHYSNLYTRTNPEKIREGAPAEYGFLTLQSTKQLIMSAKKIAMREGKYIERDIRATDEAAIMEIKPTGNIKAIDGRHDDIEVPTAIGIYVSDHMPIPKIQKENNTFKFKQTVSNQI